MALCRTDKEFDEALDEFARVFARIPKRGPVVAVSAAPGSFWRTRGPIMSPSSSARSAGSLGDGSIDDRL